MEKQPFLQSIRARTGLDEKSAVGAAEATLQTLGEIIPQEDRKKLKKQLPKGLETHLTSVEADQDTGRAGPSEGRDLATSAPPDHVPETGEDES